MIVYWVFIWHWQISYKWTLHIVEWSSCPMHVYSRRTASQFFDAVFMELFNVPHVAVVLSCREECFCVFMCVFTFNVNRKQKDSAMTGLDFVMQQDLAHVRVNHSSLVSHDGCALWKVPMYVCVCVCVCVWESVCVRQCVCVCVCVRESVYYKVCRKERALTVYQILSDSDCLPWFVCGWSQPLAVGRWLMLSKLWNRISW